jgi:acetyl-CoA carboxylase biotin carboxyl carrier protein
MTIEEIKELLAIFNASGVAEMDVQRGDNRLRIRRAGSSTEYLVASPPSAPAPAPAAPPPNVTAPSGYPPSAPAAASPSSSGKPSDAADPNQVLVRSPIVGTYYEAPAPGAASFVRVGDAVEPGQVLCIIESMKLMNEIEAEVAGIVTAKLVENGRPVEYGEALFSIRPR